MKVSLLTSGCILVAVIFFASIRNIISKQWPFVRAIGPDTRDAYIVIGLLAGIVLFFSGAIDSLEIGGLARLRKVEEKTVDLSKQVEQLYKARVMEIFTSADPKRVRFQKRSDDYYDVEIVLKNEPIIESLQIMRSSLVVSPTTISVNGKTVKFLTYSNTFEGPADTIVAQYYPLSESSRRMTQ